MKTFEKNGLSEMGHPGQAQIQALADGRAGEATRSYLAQHMATCDDCLEEYLRLLENEPLLAPASSPAAAAQAVVKRKSKKRASLARFATVAAAACLAVVMWGCGAAANAQRQDAMAANEPVRPGFSQQLNAAADGVADAFNSFFGSIGKLDK